MTGAYQHQPQHEHLPPERQLQLTTKSSTRPLRDDLKPRHQPQQLGDGKPDVLEHQAPRVHVKTPRDTEEIRAQKGNESPL